MEYSLPQSHLSFPHTHKILYPLQKLTQVDHSLKCKEDIFSGILLSHEKEWNNAICSNMDGHRDYHTKNKVKQRTTNVWNWLCVTFKKNDTSELTYKTDIDSQTEKTNMVFQGEGRQRNKLGAWNEHIHHTV